MNIYTLQRRGLFHHNFSEDALFQTYITPHLFVGAVFDGCSGGKESHFASALGAKILKKITALQEDLAETYSSLEEQSYSLLKNYVKETKKIKKELLLSNEELFSTLLLLLCDTQRREVFIVALGDGVICYDGSVHYFDHQNIPDYPTYHFSDSDTDLLRYFRQQTLFITEVQDLSIATDGILSFQDIDDQSKIRAEEFLCIDTTFMQYPSMLEKKCNLLKNKYQLEPADDLTMIRLIFDH